MSDENDKKRREDLALDALLAAAFTQELCDEDAEDLKKLSAVLTPEDRAALEADSKDRIAKLFQKRPAQGQAPKRLERGLATSLNRADEDQELSDKAQEEIEQKIRAAEEAKRKKEGEKPGGPDDGRRD